ncbi:hypothetical protein KM043_007823 [Ampulex compressa]|nr:hypothetical protein KM043_007823 [Ampulex compressa]
MIAKIISSKFDLDFHAKIEATRMLRIAQHSLLDREAARVIASLFVNQCVECDHSRAGMRPGNARCTCRSSVRTRSGDREGWMEILAGIGANFSDFAENAAWKSFRIDFAGWMTKAFWEISAARKEWNWSV